MQKLYYYVTTKYDGNPLMDVLKDELHLSGYHIRRCKRINGAISVNGVNFNVTNTIHEGDVVSVLLNNIERKSNVVPSPGPIDITYEDDDIIVLNKRAEDIIHPDHAHITNTLGNYLMYYYIQKNDPADFHPVHRLDKGTSGLVLFAKHAYAQNILSNEIHEGQFIREYIALCTGVIHNDSDIIDKPIYRPELNSIKRCTGTDGQKAITGYNVIKRYSNSTLVSLSIKTGRTHQIRVHMSSIGHPLVGDTLYGGNFTDNIFRPALHSHKIEFTQPISKRIIKLKAPLPEDILSEIQSQR